MNPRNLDSVSTEAKRVLRLLKTRRNVLLEGAPATGKTRLANEVREAFLAVPISSYQPDDEVAIPRAGGSEVADWLPSPDRTNRRVFQTAFFAGSKHRDFVRGIVPVPGGETLTFRVSSGTLYEASEHALSEDGASLVVIEEISRGPAVAVFGGAIVAFEVDKRLGDDGRPLETTAFFETCDDAGERLEYALPAHLYLLATMNRADTSVEALDVAFLRRWASYKIDPNAAVLRTFFAVESDGGELPREASTPDDVHRAAIAAWSAVNRRISVGRGVDFQIGHGVLMQGGAPEVPDGDTIRSLTYVAEGWEAVLSHVREVFFADDRSIAQVLSIGAHNPEHPYQLRELIFAGEPRTELVLPPATPESIYQILISIARDVG